tara:strand:- start:3422 stop:4720 length:1299 start_codon:yes stop_codon:yes gene_type:complete
MANITDILSKCLSSKNVCIDSRKLERGDFFVALKGSHTSGNQFVRQALNQGASYALIDDPSINIDDRCILVDDALKTLQEIATEYRRLLKNMTVLCIAGSNGKTTTKELLYHVLSKRYNTYCTLGNLNNHIGVPLSILNCSTTHEIAVIEIGANHCGEHTLLCNIAQPNFGIITNCGKDHLDGYGSIEGVIQSNNELYEYIRSNHGHVFVNSDDNTLMDLSRDLSRTLYGTRKEGEHVNASINSLYPTLELTINNGHKNWTVQSQLYGTFQASNIAAALSIGHYFNIDMNHMLDAIKRYIPKNNRSEAMNWHGNKVLLDAYNANPSSVVGMIEYFKDLSHMNKVIILGDMAELGSSSFGEHKQIVDHLKSLINCQVILVGNEFEPFINELNCLFFKDTTKLMHYIKDKTPFQNATILVKGSRRHSLETLFRS